MKGLRAITAAAALLALATACGYSVGYQSYGPRGRTVAVEVVDNRSFRQRIEIPLTQQVIEQLTIQGDLRPASRRDADTVLEIVLVDIQGRSLVGPGGGFPVREGALDFAAEARLKDRPSGSVLKEVRVIDRAEFRSPVGETESSAIDEAVYDLARKIVLALEDDF